MIKTSEFIKEKFRQVNKEVEDDAVEDIEKRFIDIDMNLDYEKNRNDEDCMAAFNMILKLSSNVADDANRNIVTLEDLDIMYEFPKEDISIPTAPIKRLIDNNCSKKINKDAAGLLASKIDDYCIDILKEAEIYAKKRDHPTITLEDINDVINIQ